MNLWLILIGMGLVTFAARLTFILLIGRIDVPDKLRGVLRFVPPAVFGTIISLEVLRPGGVLTLSPLENIRLISAALAVIAAWRTKKILPTIAVGMISLWVLQAVIG